MGVHTHSDSVQPHIALSSDVQDAVPTRTIPVPLDVHPNPGPVNVWNRLPATPTSQGFTEVSLLTALTESFGVSTGVLLFLILLFVFKFRRILTAYIRDRFLNRDSTNSRYQLIYKCISDGATTEVVMESTITRDPEQHVNSNMIEL